MNKKFIKICVFIAIILFVALVSMNFTIENFKYKDVVKVADTKEQEKDLPIGSISSKDERKVLSAKQAKENLDMNFFNKLIDIIFEYRMNNIDDYNYLDDGKFEEFSKDEYIEDILTPCTIASNEKYGEVVHLMGAYNVYIEFSLDGKNVSVSRFFNYAVNQKVSVNFDEETIEWLLDYAKDFFRCFSEELGEKFEPDICYLDESGHVYALEDSVNDLTFKYDFLYKCPTEFAIGFGK